MRTLPIDTSKFTTVAGGAATAATTPNGEQRRDADGRPLFAVPIVVLVEGGDAETLTVRVPGPPPELTALQPVKLVGLTARPWSMGDRSGVSFSCTAIQAAGRS